MKFMNKSEWDAMSLKQRAEHFTKHDVEVDSKFLYGQKRFQAVCGGVQVSGWWPAESDALEESARAIASSFQSLVIERMNVKHMVNSTLNIKN